MLKNTLDERTRRKDRNLDMIDEFAKACEIKWSSATSLQPRNDRFCIRNQGEVI
jgi:hypothetical protein